MVLLRMNAATAHIRDLDKLNLVKLACGGFVFGSSQFLPQPPQKMTLTSRVVINDLNIGNHLALLV